MFWDIMGVERKYTQCVSVILISRNTCAECHFVSHDLYVACYVNAGCAVLLVLVLVIDPSVLISSCRVCVVFTFWVWYLVCGACVFSASCFSEPAVII